MDFNLVKTLRSINEEVEKRYYVAEVVKLLNISRKTLYNWESLKKIPSTKRDPMSGFRYWNEDDFQKLMQITGRGFTYNAERQQGSGI